MPRTVEFSNPYSRRLRISFGVVRILNRRAALNKLRIARLTPEILDHTSQDHKTLAHAVLLRAVDDLQSSDPDIWGPAWDFFMNPDFKEDLDFWAANARIDPQIIREWANNVEKERLGKRKKHQEFLKVSHQS